MEAVDTTIREACNAAANAQAQAREALEYRDTIIYNALQTRHTWASMTELTGLSRTIIQRIVRKGKRRTGK